jgi:inosine/xanthosine triphosphatase
MIIAIGTQNPTKLNAVKAAFSPYMTAEFVSTNVSSDVSPQPLTDNETMTGAINRAKNAFIEENAEIGVGLEGGVIKTNLGYFLCNWGAVIDRHLKPIVAGGARIVIPEEIGKQVFSGLELGDVMDSYVEKHNVRHNEGAIGIFTNGVVDRTEMFTHLSRLLIGQYLYKQDR